MPKRRRVSRPHPQPDPPRRLVTKARKQERDEEHGVGLPVPEAPKAQKVRLAPGTVPPARQAPSDKTSFGDSPDLLAILTGRKKKPVA